jgi:hypothetical protein
VRSGDLSERPAVVVATEPMDEDPAWSPLASGELLHIDRALRVTRRLVLPEPPAHPLTLAELAPDAAAAQAPSTRGSAATVTASETARTSSGTPARSTRRTSASPAPSGRKKSS